VENRVLLNRVFVERCFLRIDALSEYRLLKIPSVSKILDESRDEGVEPRNLLMNDEGVTAVLKRIEEFYSVADVGRER
jgi:hypothetical protein